MNLDEYIKSLQEIRDRYRDGEIPVIVQTLTHRFPADEPAVRLDLSDKPFVLINP